MLTFPYTKAVVESNVEHIHLKMGNRVTWKLWMLCAGIVLHPNFIMMIGQALISEIAPPKKDEYKNTQRQ